MRYGVSRWPRRPRLSRKFARRPRAMDGTVRFSLSTRPILAATEDAAWARARGNHRSGSAKFAAMRCSARRRKAPQAVGSQRLLAAAAKGEVLDKRLWTAVAAATGARGNTTALVGTPEQVAESMLAYYDLGVTTFPDSRFRSARRRDRLWPRVDPDRATRDRPSRSARGALASPGASQGKEFMATKLLAIVGSVTPPGRLLNATQWLLDTARASQAASKSS